MNCWENARSCLETWLVLRACSGELPPEGQAREGSQMLLKGGAPAPLLSCVMKGVLDRIWSGGQDVITNRDLKAMG